MLGVVAVQPTHGWPVVRELAADGVLGRVWTVPRPIVYRSLSTLARERLIEQCDKVSDRRGRGPKRTVMRATRRGRSALSAWLEVPVSHVRDMRSEFLLKLALLARFDKPATELIEIGRAHV